MPPSSSSSSCLPPESSPSPLTADLSRPIRNEKANALRKKAPPPLLPEVKEKKVRAEDGGKKGSRRGRGGRIGSVDQTERVQQNATNKKEEGRKERWKKIEWKRAILCLFELDL